MTQGTHIITISDYKAQIQGLLARIRAGVARLAAFQITAGVVTNLHPVGIRGWLKQLQNILRVIQNIERMIALVLSIIAQIALLPAEALAIAVADVAQNVAVVIGRIRAAVAAKLHRVLDSTISPSTRSKAEQLQTQYAEAQSVQTDALNLYSQVT